MSLVLVLLLQDPADLVRSLLSDDLQIRDHAVVQVAGGGRTLLEKVRALARKDLELQARLLDAEVLVSRAERLRGFQGGEPVNGISAGLELEVDRCTQDLVVTLELANVSLEERTVRWIRSWSRSFPTEFDSSGGSEARVIVKQVEGADILGGLIRGRHACGSGRRISPVDRLAPGSRTSASHRISPGTLPDGIHEVTVEYQPTGSTTDPLRIRVQDGIPELLAR